MLEQEAREEQQPACTAHVALTAILSMTAAKGHDPLAVHRELDTTGRRTLMQAQQLGRREPSPSNNVDGAHVGPTRHSASGRDDVLQVLMRQVSQRSLPSRPEADRPER